jgi:tol-pal system protein YbgF
MRRRRLKSNLLIVIFLAFVISFGCSRKEKILSAREYFDQGAGYFKEKRFTQARLEFRKILERYPKSEWADNAQFGLGLVCEELGDYQDAVEELKKVARNYPAGDKAPNALFGAGEIYEKKLQNRSGAVASYTQLIKEYPASGWAPKARERIERLEKGGEK